MRFFLGLTTGIELGKLERLCNLADRWEIFGGVWIGEAEDSGYDLFSTIGLLLQGTSRIEMGVMIPHPQAYNISTVARAAATLWELEEGRVRLGVHTWNIDQGSTEMDREDHLNKIEGWIGLLRRIWRNEGFISSGDPYPLKGYQMGFGPYRVPITLVGMNPGILELAGRVADGVIIKGPRGYLEEAISWVKRGLSGREVGEEFSLGVWPPILWDEAPDRASLIRGLAETPRSILVRSGIHQGALESIITVYREAGVERASGLVTGEILDAYCFHGDIKRITRELRSLEDLGVSEVVLEPISGGDIISSIVEAWGEG